MDAIQEALKWFLTKEINKEIQVIKDNVERCEHRLQDVDVTLIERDGLRDIVGENLVEIDKLIVLRDNMEGEK